MKTLKLALVATLVAFTMVSTVSADGFKSKPKFTKRVNITLENALQNPGLTVAMYAQLDEADVLYFPSLPYLAEVKYDNAIYRISATRTQWIRFFKMKGLSPGRSREVAVGAE